VLVVVAIGWILAQSRVSPARLDRMNVALSSPVITVNSGDAVLDSIQKCGFKSVALHSDGAELRRKLERFRDRQLAVRFRVDPETADLLQESNPEWIFPEFTCPSDPASVPEFWEQIAEARRELPNHTFIVGFASGSLPSQENRPKGETNLVYGFRFTAPERFTAPVDEKSVFARLPFPSSPKLVAGILPDATDAEKLEIVQYGRERWDAEKLRLQVAQADAWRKKNRAPVVCLGFPGDLNTNRAARLAYARAVREALVGFSIPWTVEAGTKGRIGNDWSPDTDLLVALGLR
jgi:hypothetical protein